MWLRIEKFDPEMHITLFGAFDTSQKCFCMAYIEQDTHKLVLQTSLRSSVRFKLFEFTQGRWYHVAISHKRPRTTTSARRVLHVDGALVDQVEMSLPHITAHRKFSRFSLFRDTTNIRKLNSETCITMVIIPGPYLGGSPS